MIITKDFVYARPAKTGSSTVTTLLQQAGIKNMYMSHTVPVAMCVYSGANAPWYHLTPSEVDMELPDHLVVSVRHPVEQYISAFQYQCGLLGLKATESYLLDYIRSKQYPSVLLGKQQSDYFSRAFNKVTLLRLDSLQEDLSNLLGAEVPAMHSNASVKTAVSAATIKKLEAFLQKKNGSPC